MRVLVTGAHGFIGSHLVEKLVAEGASVRALVSPWGTLENLSAVQGKIDIVRADVSEPESLTGVCDGVNLIYHAAARVADYGPATAFRRVNVEGTNHLLREAERANVTRFVLVSSVAVHRYTGFRDADPRALPPERHHKRLRPLEGGGGKPVRHGAARDRHRPAPACGPSAPATRTSNRW